MSSNVINNSFIRERDKEGRKGGREGGRREGRKEGIVVGEQSALLPLSLHR